MKHILRSVLLSYFLLFCCGYLNAQIQVFGAQEPLDSAINSAYHEVNVVISPDDNFLFFTRANHPENIGGVKDKGDIWVSEFGVEGKWKTPKNCATLNDDKHSQVIGFLDPRTMLVRKGTRLFSYYYFNGKWFEPKPFEIPFLKPTSDHFSASVSHDGNYIVIAMESFGSHGVEDIYISKKKPDDTWSPVKNLGTTVNSKYQEITPFLAEDNKTLFFSSNGNGGEGSFDVFMTQRKDDTWKSWTEPVSLGKALNTEGRESSFTFSSEQQTGYLISTQNSEGYGDVKMVKVESEIEEAAPSEVEQKSEIEDVSPIVVKLTGKVVNELTGRPEPSVLIKVSNVDRSKVYEAISDVRGEYKVELESGLSYLVESSKKLFLPATKEMFVGVAPISEYSFSVQPIVDGSTLALEHVLFERGEAVLLDESRDELEQIVSMMNANPEVSIFLSGHTDNQGKASSNLKLSQDRVATVKKFLVEEGISSKRIDGKGYGGTKPRASNASLDTRKLNRRVEVTFKVPKK